jgi:DnaJ-class molecular chaperone
MNLSRRNLTPPVAPRKRCAAQQPTTGNGQPPTNGRGPTDCPTATCPRCDGSGEIGFNPSPINDPQCADSAPCNVCHGEGVVSELTAQAFELGWLEDEAA